MERMRNRWTAAALTVLLLATPVAAQTSDAGRAGSDFGVGVVTVVTNVGYIPVKLGYALLGGITGSLAWALTGGNREVADGIWVPSLGGDYVLTARMLTGEEPVHFSGVRDRDYRPAAEPRRGSGSGDVLF